MPQTAERPSASPSPQEQVLGIAVGFVQARCLIAAAELGLADALANGPLPVGDIAKQTETDAENLFRPDARTGSYRHLSTGIQRSHAFDDHVDDVDILDEHPGCRGVIFDQPEVVSTAIEHDRVER
jgi:hypothetical protein